MLQFFIKYVGTIKLHVNLLSETNEKKKTTAVFNPYTFT